MRNEPSSRPVRDSLFLRELKRWYSFNQQKIPMIFMILSGLLVTASLDFKMTLADRVIDFRSHISAIIQFVSSPLANMTGFLLFGIYLLAIIQMLNAITFAKKRSPTGLILINALTVVQIVFVSLYTAAFFAEVAARTDYVIDEVARRSYTIMIVGVVLMTLGAVATWFYVDWHYVKEVED